MRLLIVGCGYVGCALAKVVVDQGGQVFALTRSAQRKDELGAQGVTPIVGDWLQLESLVELPSVDYVLVSIPHRAAEGYDEKTHSHGLACLLHSLPPNWKKLVYLSTTGVYGECDSDVVTEDTPPSPSRIGPRIALRAEQWLHQEQMAGTYTILRLAGIYGPGRIPLAAHIRSGKALAVPQEGYLNLVHVTDIAQMLLQIFQRELARNCYLFSDGRPVIRREFYERLAKLCGVARPVFTDPHPYDARVRRATSKRIDPSRLVAETGYEFTFPNYEAGLIDAV